MTADATVVAWTDGPSVVAGYRLSDGEWETASLGEGSRPRVAVNAAGLAVVVWQRPENAGSAVEASVRTGTGPWTSPTIVSSAARFPTATVNAAGLVRVLALRWEAPVPTRTDVRLFRLEGSDWSAGRVLSQGSLRNSPALRRSLRLEVDPDGRSVAGWLCPFSDLPPGEPRKSEWVCLRFPGSLSELVDRAPAGAYAMSIPKKRPIYLATPYGMHEVEPGFVFSEFWRRGGRVSSVGLDVAGRDAGVVSWQVRGPDSRVWVATRRPGRWGNAVAVARHTHGLSGVTLAEPSTALVFWRTGAHRLATGFKVGRGSWQRDTSRLGNDVERAELVSNQSGDALLGWSSSGTDPGVYVAARPAP